MLFKMDTTLTWRTETGRHISLLPLVGMNQLWIIL